MPHGRRGDHPFTDIVVHGMAVYSSEADGLVRGREETRARAPGSSRSDPGRGREGLLIRGAWPRPIDTKVSVSR